MHRPPPKTFAQEDILNFREENALVSLKKIGRKKTKTKHCSSFETMTVK